MIEGFICSAQENIVGHIGLLLHSKAINISALHPELVYHHFAPVLRLTHYANILR
jgi:hypothetical protein